MSYRKINIGSGEGAGDGDSLRLAFEKANSNSQNADTRLQVLETGVVRADGTVTGNIIPDTDVTYDLGSSSKKFKDLYLSGNTITLGNQTISSTASGINTSGNITSAGTIQATTITSTQPSSLSGSFTGDLKGSVYADGSETMIDGVAGVILGPVKNAITETDVLVAPFVRSVMSFGVDALQPTTSIDQIGIKTDSISGPLSISATKMAIAAATKLEIRSTNIVHIEGEGGAYLIGGEVSPGSGPSDVAITGGPITMNGPALLINTDETSIAGDITIAGNIDFTYASFKGFTPFSITGDDSTVRNVTAGSTIGIVGGTGITTASDADGNITITASSGSFDGAFSSLTGTPTTLAGYGITDAQSALVSGTSIKTINGTSLLGSGDVTISASGADLSAVNQNYTPDTDNAYDLGIAAGNFLRTGYFKTSVVIDNATLTYNADGELQSSATINTYGLTSSSYMAISAGFGGLIFWQERGGNIGGLSGMNGNDEMVWYGSNYSANGPTYQLDNDQANLQIGGEVTKTISGITLGATTSLSLSGPYYPNPNSTVTITGVVGTTELNNQTYYIDSSNNLYSDPSLSTPINSSAFTPYVSGGTAVVAPRATASLPVLHSAPSAPKSGMMAVADGTNWNPTSTGTETMVVYLGGAWRTIANA